MSVAKKSTKMRCAGISFSIVGKSLIPLGKVVTGMKGKWSRGWTESFGGLPCGGLFFSRESLEILVAFFFIRLNMNCYAFGKACLVEIL